MYYDQKENITWQSTEKPNSINKNEEKPSALVELTEEESKKLFISIGKNRRLFPREIITLILSKTSSEREDIGMIKILDNYSFVQVRDSKAEEIINALNGLRFRGRTLTVNFAKPKNIENDT
jgi:RNA recognition motif-containing protein